MKTKLLLLLITVSAICALLYVPSSTTSTPAYAASQEVVAREVTIAGRQVGEILVGDQIVVRIRTSAGGFSPYQRAQEVAQRIQRVTATSMPSTIVMRRVNGQYAVVADGTLLVTAGPAEAQLNGMTTAGLANFWALRISSALGVTTVDATPTPTSQKIVPIISIGSGTRVGGALVAGASSRLSEVVAVAQIEGTFQGSVRIRALVPVSTTDVVSNIKRVPETAVIGLVDIKL